ncbi:MAG: macro domain-containing protein [Saprospirales bacterium]|nr:macro domain-containing protein [Saprospirales bacterium]
MIRIQKGNLLQAQTEAIVNTVNTVGVMGKGIALQFREAFPENYKLYRQAVNRGDVVIGKMFVYRSAQLDGTRYIINFPTKEEWFRPSSYAYIEEGLKDLVRVIQLSGIKSVAIPPLGCGHGGLDWKIVKTMIEQAMSSLPEVEVVLYEPDAKVNEILAAQGSDKETKLTPARAMMLYLLFYYEALGEEASLFAANKLSYFLQQFGEKQLKLRFVRHYYGPYSSQVDHLMYALNGKYLSGLEQRSAKAFDPLRLNYAALEEVQQFLQSQLNPSEQDRIRRVAEFIDGFASPLALEALASVYSILEEYPDWNEDQVFGQIQEWSARKKNIFSRPQIDAAYKHLQQFRHQLIPT